MTPSTTSPTRRPEAVLLSAAALLVAALAVISLLVGKYPLTLEGILHDEMQRQVFLTLRLPRALTGVVGGFALGVCGFVYQTVFRNPLASPDIIGVSSGASAGAAAGILFLSGAAGITLAAFGGALAAVVLALGLSALDRRGQSGTIVLAGIAVHALAQTVLMCLKLTADPERELASIEYWIMGSLNGIKAGALPVKASYVTSCYRYEKPQAGRLREFHQFGVECFGAAAPQADAEIITLAATILESLGVTGVQLHINSIGCPECRAQYHAALKEYFTAHKESLCGTCLDRLERNPMRILDCKSPECAAVAAGAPVMLDYLCDDCAAHFEEVKACLTDAGLSFELDPHIVRGLDYYTRTVFEFISDALGAQSTVCGGGRYDGLIEELGGAHVPSLGFGMGLERLLMVMEAKGVSFPETPVCEVYFASMGEAAARRCFTLTTKLRQGGVAAECDTVGRSLKAQMKYADKIGARYTLVVGDDELASGTARLKDMATGETEDVTLDDGLYSVLYNKSLDRQLAGMTDLLGEELGGLDGLSGLSL